LSSEFPRPGMHIATGRHIAGSWPKRGGWWDATHQTRFGPKEINPTKEIQSA